MKCLNRTNFSEMFQDYAEKIVLFGDGKLLRGLVGWMIHRLNMEGLFEGKIIVVQETPLGDIATKLNLQDGLYTVLIRGVAEGRTIDKTEVVSSISRGINSTENWAEVLRVAENAEIKIVLTDTAETGLTFTSEVYRPDDSPQSFPAKLTSFLYQRYISFDGSSDAGLTIIPCEATENNGDILQQSILQHAEEWGLPERFVEWIIHENHFSNTAVDRMVHDCQHEDTELLVSRLGYKDELVTICEPYYFFATDAEEQIKNLLPFHKIGLHVHWGDVTPFYDLELRLFYGAQMLLCSIGLLLGKNMIYEAMQDDHLRLFMKKGIYLEILPVLDLPIKDKKEFADLVVERLMNPFMLHKLSDIAEHGIDNFKMRIVPILLRYHKEWGQLPETICLSFAAFISIYQRLTMEKENFMVNESSHLNIFHANSRDVILMEKIWAEWSGKEADLRSVLNNLLEHVDWWGTDLRELDRFEDTVLIYLRSIQLRGMESTLQEFLGMDYA